MTNTITLKKRQGGAIAIIVGLSLVVLIGFIGLVLDLGHLYIAKTELQNAADACALGAVRELDQKTDALTRAIDAGRTVGNRNRVDFQTDLVSIQDGDITFSATWPFVPGASATTAKYVRCAPHESNPKSFAMWFMQMLGFGDQTVNASAVAALLPAQTFCGIPIGICTDQASKGSPLANWGLAPGQGVNGRLSAGMTGSFNWIDFTPPAGGSSELEGLLSGEGQCSTDVTNNVGQTGTKQSLQSAWNTRFGMYTGNFDSVANQPDYSSFAYFDPAWETATAPFYTNKYDDFALRQKAPQGNAYQGDASGLKLRGYSNDHSHWAHRRLVLAPVVRCQDWASAQAIPIRDWACVLMLHPISDTGQVTVEFRALASDPSSPCASTGLPGGQSGPLVSTLVQ